MKRVLLLFAIFGIIISVKAQEQKIPRNQIEISYGCLSTNHFLSLLWNNFNKSMNYNVEQHDSNTFADFYKSSGNINISYKFRPLKKFYVGVSFICDFNHATLTNKNRTNFGRVDFVCYTIAIEAKYLYLNSKLVQLYGFLGAGYTFSANKDVATSRFFNGQLTPIGIRVGKKIGGFAEIGFGYKGVANVGLSLNI